MLDDQLNHSFKEKQLIFYEKLKSFVNRLCEQLVFGKTVHVFDENWQTVCDIWSSIVLKQRYLSLKYR